MSYGGGVLMFFLACDFVWWVTETHGKASLQVCSQTSTTVFFKVFGNSPWQARQFRETSRGSTPMPCVMMQGHTCWMRVDFIGRTCVMLHVTYFQHIRTVMMISFSRLFRSLVVCIGDSTWMESKHRRCSNDCNSKSKAAKCRTRVCRSSDQDYTAGPRLQR